MLCSRGNFVAIQTTDAACYLMLILNLPGGLAQSVGRATFLSKFRSNKPASHTPHPQPARLTPPHAHSSNRSPPPIPLSQVPLLVTVTCSLLARALHARASNAMRLSTSPRATLTGKVHTTPSLYNCTLSRALSCLRTRSGKPKGMGGGALEGSREICGRSQNESLDWKKEL